ncbi:AraC family transcriptional regulator [Gemmatimonas sp.]|uniref:AraC family transcriptional regulator n=1 Tax=Gemmatimonas sp. TaxID=1962908 RepID=UPI00398347F1
MDLLSELMADAGLVRRVFDQRWLTPERAVRFPCDRSVGFHVVLEGVVFVHAPALVQPLRLEAGDIAVMGRGCVHVLSTHVSPDAVPIASIPTDRTPDSTRTNGVAVVSGAYQLWNAPLHPFFAELPEWFVLPADRAPGLDPLGLTVAMLADEARRDALGRQTVVHGLLDVLFTYLMREIVARRGQTGAGWSHAVSDPHVRKAVAHMHDEPARAWTLEALAGAVGLSRSVLAERFREVMRDTPLAYLRVVRMQRAMRLLVESDRTLEQVANAVGYQDAFGFSKAFKRAVGVSPGDYRRRDAAERDVPWRFRAGAVPS